MVNLDTPTIIEQRYITEHDYKLPAGWTWNKLHAEREKANESEHYLPEVTSSGEVIWIFPIKGYLSAE